MNLTLEQVQGLGRGGRGGRGGSAAPPVAAAAAEPDPGGEDSGGVWIPGAQGPEADASVDPLSWISCLPEALQFKAYVRRGVGARAALEWVGTFDAPPTEEELLHGFGPGRYRIRALAEGGAIAGECEVNIGRAPALGGRPQAAPAAQDWKALLPYLPQFVTAIRGNGASGGQGLSMKDVTALLGVVRELQETAAPVDPGPDLAGAAAAVAAGGGPWWAPLLAAVAPQILGPGATPQDLTPAAVAAFLNRPGNLDAVVTQLASTPEGAALLGQVKEALK